MLRWWIMSFIIPIPLLLCGIASLTIEPFYYAGIDNLTMAIPWFIIYVVGVGFTLVNYDRVGMLSKNLEDYKSKEI